MIDLFMINFVVQPLRLEAKKKFSTRSDRVKCVDIHPTEPWILASLYNGHVYIWNYTNQVCCYSFFCYDQITMFHHYTRNYFHFIILICHSQNLVKSFEVSGDLPGI